MRIFLVLVAMASVASANPKYSRKQDLHLDVKLSPRTRPAPPPERRTPEATTPAVDADDVLDHESADHDRGSECGGADDLSGHEDPEGAALEGGPFGAVQHRGGGSCRHQSSSRLSWRIS